MQNAELKIALNCHVERSRNMILLRSTYLLFAFLFLLAAKSKSQPFPKELNLSQQSPDSFIVEFKTTKGNFSITAHRAWSPLACDRLYLLVKNNWYNNTVIYRVAPTRSYKGGKIVQFGVSNNPAANYAWRDAGIKDEPVVHPHEWGAVCFARDSINSRSTDIAISLAPGIQLDTVNYKGVIGFPTFALVTNGMEVLQSFNGEYGNTIVELPDDSLFLGRAFFDRKYPGLDRIILAAVVKAWGRYAQSDTNDIINQFSKVNAGIQIDPEEVNQETNNKYEQVLHHLDSIHADPGLKEKATQLKIQTLNLLEKIDSIKFNAATNIQTDTDVKFIKDGSASYLKKLLNTYKDNLRKFYFVSETDKDKIEQLLSTNDTLINTEKVTWEDSNFQGKPSVVILALLAKKESEIKKSERVIIEAIFNMR